MNDNNQNFYNDNYINQIRYTANLKNNWKEYIIKYKKYIKIGIIILIFLIIIITISSINKNKHNKTCNNIESNILKATDNYILNNQASLPTIGGKYIIVSLDDLINGNYLEKMTVKEKVCTGTVKITKVNDEYIKTLNLSNCSYCDTDKRYNEYSKEVTKKPTTKNTIIEPVAYYNYQISPSYNTSWTNWFESSEISKEKSQYNVYPPLDESKLPKLTEDAIIVSMEQQNKTFYSYRDKSYKFYHVKNNNYSGFYSEKPKGYKYKDENTKIQTEFSKWSINYPDVYDYRVIHTGTAYQWYYEEKGKKIYWNNGEYSVNQPDEKYSRRSSNTITMYRYYDYKWRFYNGSPRQYSGFRTTSDSYYRYKDKQIYNYSNWSYWMENSQITKENKSYREQRTDKHSRYRIKYRLNTFMQLPNNLTETEFETKVGKSVEEIYNTKDNYLDINYKYRYRKLK